MNDIEKQKLIKRLLEIAKREIRLNYYKSDNPLDTTTSKIGGRPSVPLDFEWPLTLGPSVEMKKAKRRQDHFLFWRRLI